MALLVDPSIEFRPLLAAADLDTLRQLIAVEALPEGWRSYFAAALPTEGNEAG